jgi:hypothetical protein
VKVLEQVVIYGENMSKCDKNSSCEKCNCKESQTVGKKDFPLNSLTKKPSWASSESGYKLTLRSPYNEEGYALSFDTKIDIFQFFNLFQEYFKVSGLKIDITYRDED